MAGNEPDEVLRWHGEVLRRVQALAAEHQRVTRAGPQLFDDGGPGDPRQVWNERVAILTMEREHAELTALLGGVDPDWVIHARELGARSVDDPARTAIRAHPPRADAGAQFFLDMLELDQWKLERMASLEAARIDRVRASRWTLPTDPVGQARFAENMQVLHTRITSLAAAARLTPAEGELLWGASVEGIRRVHAAALEKFSDHELAQEWALHAHAEPEMPVPPYVPHDPDTGMPTDAAMAIPPTPRQMLADAISAQRLQAVDTAIRGTEPQADIAREGTAVTALVDAALPAPNELGDQLGWDPETDPPIWRETATDLDHTPEP